DIAAYQCHTIAAANLIARAGDRHVQVPDATRDNPFRECCHPIRIAGAHAQHRLSGAVAERGQQMALDYLLHLVGIEHRNDDAARRTSRFGNRLSRAAANIGEPGAACTVNVETGYGNIRVKQTLRVNFSHQAETDNGDGRAHRRPPSRLRMRKAPIELARLAVERAWLQRTVVNTVDGHDLGIIPRREDLVGILHVAVTQGRFNYADASIT